MGGYLGRLAKTIRVIIDTKVFKEEKLINNGTMVSSVLRLKVTDRQKAQGAGRKVLGKNIILNVEF
jgi:hypothetical protein